MRKKICLLGASAVGKTSLVRRFVESIFSDDYLSTVGVKVDRKVVSLPDGDVTLLVWDIHGEHGSLTVLPQYLRGSAAHLVVVDASRPVETAAVAERVLDRSARDLPDVPYVLALNKSDLISRWGPVEAGVSALARGAAGIVHTSAKTAEGVDDAFRALAATATA